MIEIDAREESAHLPRHIPYEDLDGIEKELSSLGDEDQASSLSGEESFEHEEPSPVIFESVEEVEAIKDKNKGVELTSTLEIPLPKPPPSTLSFKWTKDVSNEYDPIFVLKHEVLYEGLREYFMFLMPKEQVHATVVCIYSIILNEIKVQQYQELIYIMPLDIVNFMLQTHDESYIDKSTNKAYRFNIEQYAHHCQFFDKRKLASHPFLFVPICNGAHWWLWIADVNKKKFYVLDPINKLPKNIHDSRKTVNKFVVRINNFSDEGLCWGGTINGGWTGSRSRVYPTKWSTYRGEIDSFRYEYGPHILLHEMNKIRDQVIWESEAIRLTKLSAALSSSYCKFTFGNLDSK
ncbi:hypothetical protein AHAS_Ahas07G0097100 [Arachis hypogaea]